MVQINTKLLRSPVTFKKNPDQAVLVLIQPQRYGDYHNFHLVTNNYYLDPKWSTRLSNRVWKVTLAE